MIRHTRLTHRFVDSIPRALEPGVLYVSMDHGTVIHSCCCGCGQEVVTPLTPTDWQLAYDGETISLAPSVGNWQLPCRSHYVIRRNLVIEAGPWTRAQVEQELRRDRKAKALHYAISESAQVQEQANGPALPKIAPDSASQTSDRPKSLWGWLQTLFR